MEESFVGGDGFRRVRTFVTGLLVGLGMYAKSSSSLIVVTGILLVV